MVTFSGKSRSVKRVDAELFPATVHAMLKGVVRQSTLAIHIALLCFVRWSSSLVLFVISSGVLIVIAMISLLAAIISVGVEVQ